MSKAKEIEIHETIQREMQRVAVGQTMKITITRRSDDYHACIEGKPQFWGCGKTPSEAVGDLVMTWAQYFRIEYGIQLVEALGKERE